MARLRVLIVASWYPSAAAPLAGVFVQDQAQVLAARHDVAVLHPAATSLKRWLAGAAGPRSSRATSAGVELWWEVAVAVTPRWHRLAHGATRRAGLRGAAAYVREHGAPDLIHAHVALPGGAIAVELGLRLGIPVVVTEHSGPFSVLLNAGWKRGLVRRTLARADLVTAVSPALAAAMTAACPGLAPVVHGNVVRDSFFNKAEGVRAAGPLRFLTVALLSEIKGIAFLLAAAARLIHDGVSGFEIAIGGDGPERAALEAQALRLELGRHVRFLGELDRAGVRAAMQAADVFVLPSLTETFGLVLAEAMACGKPVIATRSGGPEFVVAEDAGRLVPCGDTAALATAMRAALGREPPFDGRDVRESVVARFGEAAWLTRTTTIYENLLDGHSKR